MWLNEPKIVKVYHWSPSTNREKILQQGLLILTEAYAYFNEVSQKVEVYKPPYICTSLDPWTALCYCIPTFTGEVPDLDLYEIRLSDDDVFIRNDRSIRVIEVRIRNSISVDRIQYIATRESE